MSDRGGVAGRGQIAPDHGLRAECGMIGRVPGSNSWEDSAIGTGG